MSDRIFSFQKVGFAYEPDQWVLRNCSGELAPGKVLAILGPNGCGKTTMLKLLIGALTPQEGTIWTGGRIAFVPQLFQVSFPYKVLDMVLMGRARSVGLFSVPAVTDEEAAWQALAKLKLEDLADRPFDELSGGQRQLVIFARALATEADILILDEPTSALDLSNQGIILAWLAHVAREEGLTVVFTTHHPHHAYAVADSTLLMLGEQDFIFGPTAEVMTEEHLRQLYGVELKRLRFEHQGQMRETFIPVYGIERLVPNS